MSDREKMIEDVRRFFGQHAPDPTEPARMDVGSGALEYMREHFKRAGTAGPGWGASDLFGLPVRLDESLPATEWRVYSREGGMIAQGWVSDGTTPATEAPEVMP